MAMRQQHPRGTRPRRRTTPRMPRPHPVAYSRPPLSEMTPDELRAWIGSTRAALQKKMARERTYLDRRAALGTYTPTDEAYESDQLLEADLLSMLDEARGAGLAHASLKEEADMNDTMYTLVPSANRGRYPLDDPDGGDLTTGQHLAILVGGRWIEGRVEHSNYPTHKYPDVAGCYTLTGVDGVKIGYYFVAKGGNVCGLCTGMLVRLI